jgi:hypothetical protein
MLPRSRDRFLSRKVIGDARAERQRRKEKDAVLHVALLNNAYCDPSDDEDDQGYYSDEDDEEEESFEQAELAKLEAPVDGPGCWVPARDFEVGMASPPLLFKLARVPHVANLRGARALGLFIASHATTHGSLLTPSQSSSKVANHVRQWYCHGPFGQRVRMTSIP